MSAIKVILAGGVAAAALVSAAPASAQYYPGYGSPYGGNVIGQVLGQMLGGPGYGYNNGYGYGANQQVAVSQCVGAVQARLSGGYGAYGYNNGYGGYGYNNGGYGAGRVLGISRVEPRSNGRLSIRGVATSGRYGGYGYNGQAPIDLTFKCSADYRGFITDVDIDPAQSAYGYNYTPYNSYDYSQYGYRRY